MVFFWEHIYIRVKTPREEKGNLLVRVLVPLHIQKALNELFVRVSGADSCLQTGSRAGGCTLLVLTPLSHPWALPGHLLPPEGPSSWCKGQTGGGGARPLLIALWAVSFCFTVQALVHREQ